MILGKKAVHVSALKALIIQQLQLNPTYMIFAKKIFVLKALSFSMTILEKQTWQRMLFMIITIIVKTGERRETDYHSMKCLGALHLTKLIYRDWYIRG